MSLILISCRNDAADRPTFGAVLSCRRSEPQLPDAFAVDDLIGGGESRPRGHSLRCEMPGMHGGEHLGPPLLAEPGNQHPSGPRGEALSLPRGTNHPRDPFGAPVTPLEDR